MHAHVHLPMRPCMRCHTQARRHGRWEAHIWDSAPEGQGSKGRQLHLGSFHTAVQAAKCVAHIAWQLC